MTTPGDDAMDLPHHPDADDNAPDRDPPSSGRRAATALVAIVVALLVAVVLLHLTGIVGPGGDDDASAGGDAGAVDAAETASPDADADALVFAGCMRDNGVDMPDPT
jgi:hypothetical protein